jgi:hypothetical protein
MSNTGADQRVFEDILSFISTCLIIGSLSCMLFGCGCTSMLNKKDKQADPTLSEMTIPQGFRITNAPPPIF